MDRIAIVVAEIQAIRWDHAAVFAELASLEKELRQLTAHENCVLLYPSGPTPGLPRRMAR